jgi:hypothetical protein
LVLVVVVVWVVAGWVAVVIVVSDCDVVDMVRAGLRLFRE